MSPSYSTPTNPGSTGHGLSWKLVRVTQRFPDRLTALVVDQFGKGQELRYDIMGAKGLRPEPGESWIVENKYGRWVFSAIVSGGGDGVGIEHVNGLPDALSDLDDSVSTLATTIDTRLDKNEAAGKHLWRQNSNVATTVSVPANNTPLVLDSAYAVSTAGIATFSGTNIKFNRAGRWGLMLNVEGGPTVDGLLLTAFSFGTPNPVTSDGGFLDTTAWTTATSGYVASTLSWTGWVTSAQAAVAFIAAFYWSGTSTLPVYWTLGMEYLGPF